MTRETLDESIDRVAAGLTAVPPDPTFAARLDARLDARSSRMRVWVPVAVAAAVLVAAVVVTLDRQPDPRAADHPSTAAGVEPPGARAGSDHLASATQAAVTAPRRRSRRPQAEVIEPSGTAIAALATPQTLNVDELTFASLTIAAVELGHLNLANLEVAEIDAAGEPKEQ